MREFLLQQSIHPRACYCTKECNDNNQKSASNLCEQRARACTCDGPAQSENETANHSAPVKLLVMEYHLLALKRLDIKFFYRPHRDDAHHYCRAYYSIHVKGM